MRVVSPASYKLFYDPSATGPSGLQTPPRPFVLRARNLNDRVVVPGQTFGFALHLFTQDQILISALEEGVRRMAGAGFGPARSRCEIMSFESEDRQFTFTPDLDVNQLKVVFQSPTELKHDGRLLVEPDFAPLFSRVLQRLQTLQALYGAATQAWGVNTLTSKAEQVERTSTSLQHVALSRRSSRTGQEHPIGGLIGSVVYEGALGEFVPYLRVAEWTGVGRQTTWGKGEITVEIPSQGAQQ